MILRKPYAFFIKMFKPIHFIMALFAAYLIYLDTKILNFFNSYIYSLTDVIGKGIANTLVNKLLYIIPIVLIILSFIILVVMFRKKKPVKFYIVTIVVFIIVILINLYASNFLNELEESIVAVKTVKLAHDLVLINILIESISFILFIVRGMGLNFKKFDFSSDISKIDINESDKEEFELDINVDLFESRRNRKRSLRYLKYRYVENKFLINSILVVVICILSITIYSVFKIHNKVNKEGTVYSIGNFNVKVNKTIVLNTDYRGNKITDNYLIVVDTSLQSGFLSQSLYLNDFTLKVGETNFKPTTKYSSYLTDLGTTYNQNVLSHQYTEYLFVYEIPEKFINSDMKFSYSTQGKDIDIKLNPKKFESNIVTISKNINEQLSLEDSLGDIKFKINSYEIKDKYEINYNYCVKNNDCILSREYLKPSIDTNFDKYILKLDIEYSDNTNLNLTTFYKLFSQFGSISYNIDNTWYSQNSKFEEIKSTKVSNSKNIYIGVNSDISRAISVKLVFKVRNSIYEYLLK